MLQHDLGVSTYGWSTLCWSIHVGDHGAGVLKMGDPHFMDGLQWKLRKSNGWLGGTLILGNSHIIGYSLDMFPSHCMKVHPIETRLGTWSLHVGIKMLLVFQTCVGSRFTYFAWIKLMIICIAENGVLPTPKDCHRIFQLKAQGQLFVKRTVQFLEQNDNVINPKPSVKTIDHLQQITIGKIMSQIAGYPPVN